MFLLNYLSWFKNSEYISYHWKLSFHSQSNKEILISWTVFFLSLMQWPIQTNTMAYEKLRLQTSSCFPLHLLLQSNENYLHNSHRFTWGHQGLFFFTSLLIRLTTLNILRILGTPSLCHFSKDIFWYVCLYVCIHACQLYS